MAVRDVYYPLVITFMVLNLTVVGLRLYTRVWTKSLGYDDALVVAALIGFIIFGAFEMLAIHYGIGATTLQAGYDMTKAAKYFTIAQLVYIMASGIAKVAVALVLLRLTNRSDMRAARIVLWITIGVIIILTAVVTLIFALQCRPLSVAWGVGTGTCISNSVIGQAALALSVEDVATSWLSAVFPVYLLWKVSISFKVKMSIFVLLGFGAVSSVATIIRFKYVLIVKNLPSDGGSLVAAQIISTTLLATVYSILEVGLSIFAAALVALRPMLRKCGVFDTSSGGKSSSKVADAPYRLHTFGQNRGAAGAVKLDDVDSDSQRGMITATKMDAAVQEI